MVHGVIVASLVSLLWISLQNALMHWRPAKNRFRTMLLGYLLSLPLLFIAYRWIPPLAPGIAESIATESPVVGIFHVCFFHLLWFFCYVECFYHVERSVTLRLLVELLKHGDQGVHLPEVQARYSLADMIRQRLEVLRDNGFLEHEGDVWRLRTKGLLLARATVVLTSLFQAKMQHERS